MILRQALIQTRAANPLPPTLDSRGRPMSLTAYSQSAYEARVAELEALGLLPAPAADKNPMAH